MADIVLTAINVGDPITAASRNANDDAIAALLKGALDVANLRYKVVRFDATLMTLQTPGVSAVAEDGLVISGAVTLREVSGYMDGSDGVTPWRGVVERAPDGGVWTTVHAAPGYIQVAEDVVTRQSGAQLAITSLADLDNLRLRTTQAPSGAGPIHVWITLVFERQLAA